MTRCSLFGLFAALAAIAGGSLAAAQNARAMVDDSEPETRPCKLNAYNFHLQVTLAAKGVPVAGTSLQIDGTDARLFGEKLLKPSGECIPILLEIPSFAWSVVQAPPGQTATIANGETLSPTVTVGGPGAYRLRFTSCPANCTLQRGTQTATVRPATQELTIDVSDAAPPPPETAPSVPPLSPRQPPLPVHSLATRESRCDGGGGAVDPEWVTTEPFTSEASYQLAEGPTVWSRVADLDNFLNHDSEDFEWKVQPDPPFTGLSEGQSNGQVKTEWETGSMPAVFWPSPAAGDDTTQPGDRTSVFGYWIFDCGHDGFKEEIHPPVGVAVQRPRPVQVPPSFRPAGFPNGFGTNVWVPGIVTDIWFNSHSGENADCGDTALHQPAHTSRSGCLRQPHPLGRKFTFNVYLPLSPQQRALQLGFQGPPVPLFTSTEAVGAGGGGGPEPSVIVRESGGLAWLEVTVDLRGFGGETYGRRLTAAWTYPQVDNWGALRWRIALDSMHVFDDAEPPFDDGDWRLYFNTTNLDQEWTELFSCDGCVDDDETYILNTGTGRQGGDGSRPTRARGLGPDPVLFPGQNIMVHTTGYDDEVVGDDIGTVLDRNPQTGGSFTRRSQGGDGNYRLDYRISPLGSVGRANLTPEANALRAAYTGTAGVRCGVGARPAAECEPKERDRRFRRRSIVPLLSDPAFENEGEEGSGFELPAISAARLRRDFTGVDPKARSRFLRDLRRHMHAVTRKARGDLDELVLTLERALPVAVVREVVPQEVRRSIDDLRRQRACLRRHETPCPTR